MKRDDLLRLLESTARRLGDEMRATMLAAQPTNDFLDAATMMEEAARGCARVLTDWRAAFLSSPAGHAMSELLGEDGLLTIFVKNDQRFALNGLVTGRDLPRFAYLDPERGASVTLIARGEDLAEKLPAMFLFHLCRHLTGPAPAVFMMDAVPQAVGDGTTASH